VQVKLSVIGLNNEPLSRILTVIIIVSRYDGASSSSASSFKLQVGTHPCLTIFGRNHLSRMKHQRQSVLRVGIDEKIEEHAPDLMITLSRCNEVEILDFDDMGLPDSICEENHNMGDKRTDSGGQSIRADNAELAEQ
jgi:hypothetical protein